VAGNLPVADQIGQAERTGLDFVPLTDHRTYDQVWDPGWASSKLLLLPGEEANGSPHAIVLGATRAGGPNANASAVGAHNIEVLNVASDPDTEVDYAETRWNRGFATGVTAASDCHFREVWNIAGPGQPTTWVFAADRTVRAVLDALRAGRTTVSNSITGPFLTIEGDLDGDGVHEAMGGDEVLLASRRLHPRASLRIRVQRGAGTRLLVYGAPGRSAGPILDIAVASDDEAHVIAPTLTSDHAWYRAEVRSPGQVSGQNADPTLPDQLRAAVSPLFLSVREPATPAPEIPLPGAAAGRDGAVPLVGWEHGFAGFADVAVAGRRVHVVAQRNHSSHTTIVYQQVDERGRGGQEFELSEGSGTATLPRAAAAGRDVWVVWQDERGHEQPHQPNIYLRHSRDGGESFGPALQLTRTTGRSVQPAIAVWGRYPVVAWADNSATGAFDVYAQVVGVDAAPVNVSAPGKAVDPGNPATDARSPRFPASLWPSLAASADGSIVITWQDDRFDPDPLWTGHTPPPGQPASGGTDPDNWQILSSTRIRGTWGPAVQVSVSTTSSDRHPSVTADSAGGLIVAWDSGARQSSGANLSVRSSRSADGGLTWAPSQPVALDPDAMSQRPRLSQDPDGIVRAYSCINCQRELPHVQAWAKDYASDRLEVEGVHTPEYAFEQVPSNVAAGVGRLGLTFPVALDNSYGTWNAYDVPDTTPDDPALTPETYLGAERRRHRHHHRLRRRHE
jgi:thiol-disulfide isomerase/thioredoxin